MKILNNNVNKIGRQAFRVAPRSNGRMSTQAVAAEAIGEIEFAQRQRPIRKSAALVKNPKSLHIIWNEWEHGVGFNAPAKTFSRAESGRREVKFTYSNRKVFWKFVMGMIQRGHTAVGATEKIYDAYNRQTPTKIIKNLRNDIKNNTLPPSLRIDPRSQ